MKNKRIFPKVIIVILIWTSFNSCNKVNNGTPPLTIEERTIANYLESFRGASPKLNVRFHSINITDISVSDMAILRDEDNFEYYQSKSSNGEQISIKDVPEKYKNRDLKEIIAKRVNCKFTFNKNPNSLIEQNFILDKTGQKCIYSNGFRKVTGIE
ncbi:hypothetical protein LG651_15585 [Tamlana sp. 62-3]|uniref:Uncharacterized protein n=1 Tax=Neotamlana sargassicola TaxID=2883125 RepID=A0A9X1I8X8_9FLAO|nr:hypothetical protein [Tamlana sargassicola]MCB4809678.1 hypothetical protein [Tamlana sargassicola]